MAKVIEHNTETRDRLETAIEDEAIRQKMPPAWSKLDPDGAYGRPAERLLTKPIELTFEAEFAGALHQLDPQETVSYDAHGGEVDPATVRALNAAEDRAAENRKVKYSELKTAKEQENYITARQSEMAANGDQRTFGEVLGMVEKESAARKPDPLADFIERRKPVEKPEPDPRQHEMPMKRGPKL